MSTANTVTVSCLLDDGTGTFPYDISSKVSLSAGVDLSGYGRPDEAASASACQITLTLKNDDGYFTTLATVPLSKGQAIKFSLTTSATARQYFRGRIDSISQSFQGAPGKRSVITITALDAMSDYGKRPLRSMVEQEIVTLSPTLYYTLGESEGSLSAGDTSGRGGPSLAVAGSLPALTFGTGTGPSDGLPATTFAGGQYLSVTPPTPLAMTGSWSIALFLSTTQVGQSTILALPLIDGSSSRIMLEVSSSGKIGLMGPASGGFFTTSATINDGLVHAVVVTFDGANHRVYVDGVLDVNVAGNAALNAPLRLEVGGASVTLALANFAGVISHLAIYDGVVLSGAQVLSIAGALTGFAETTDARLSRLAAYAGTTAITSSPSGQVMSGQAISGQSLLDALGVVADTEGGFLFIDGSGQLRMQGRYFRTIKTTATSVSGKVVDPDSFAVVDDTAQAINFMTVTRIDGATQTWPFLAPSTNLYPGSLDVATDTDANALARAQWIVAKHSSPGPRLPSATTTNLRSSASAATLHAREIGDRLHFTGLPATTNPSLGDVTIEGWSMRLDRDSWSFTYNLLPWALSQAAVWDDSSSLWDSAIWAQ